MKSLQRVQWFTGVEVMQNLERIGEHSRRGPEQDRCDYGRGRE
jgi:hypothetical protein